MWYNNSNKNSTTTDLDFCKSTASVWQIVGWVFMIVKIVLPILLIIFGVMDFSKAVMASKDDEIKKYYNENTYGQVKASHILITPDVDSKATDEEKTKAEEKAKKKAEKIISELKDGKEFSKLAKKYSKDSATASKGGDLGYFDLDDMVEEFSNAVKDLKVDDYTKEPVKTNYGYHIILKTGEKDKPKLSKVKKDIKDKLTTEKLDSSSTIYYETLMDIREENKVKWNDDTLKKAYEDYMKNLMEQAKKQAESSSSSTSSAS